MARAVLGALEMLEQPITKCSECVMTSAGRCPFTSRTLVAGQHLWTQGDVPTEVIFVREGLLSISTTEPSGTEALAAVRGPRALLGTESLASSQASASVEALTDATLCAATPSQLRQWIGPTSPAQSLIGLLVDEQARSSHDTNLRSGPSLARLARFLLKSAKLVDAGKKAPFSKQHVARMLGMRAETLSRCLKQLVESGLIESGRHIVVKDEAKLAEVAKGSV